jgi:hypothetical protein
MSKRPVLTITLMAALAASPASAQLGGGQGAVGGLGGTVGGLGGAVGGTIQGTVGGLGSAIGGPVGGTLGQVGGTLGGTVTQVGGAIGGTVTQVGGQLGGTARPTGFAITGSRLAYRSSPASGGGSSSSTATGDVSEFVLTNPLDDLTPVTAYLELGLGEMADLRRLRHEALIRANRDTLDRDDQGQPVRKTELIAVDPDDASLTAAQRAGFRIVGVEAINGLGIRIVTLAPPKRMNVRKGLKMLRLAAPGLQADYNHIFEPAGGALLPAMGAALAGTTPIRRGTRIAMVDGGVASHPSFANASIEQQGFAGAAQPTGHGTAIGSLLVGDQGPFRGAARGAELFVGDVYGGNPAAGSATTVVKALAWAASKKPSVINISLIGPDNRSLARAIAVLRARGIALVAAVGNDGPAAPPQYPASYPGVLAVTGVDAADRALREAGNAPHLAFAAPGADLVAALPGNGFTPVRGTSFAAPFVTARLAATGSTVRLAGEAVPGKGRVGRGIVCRSCRILPKVVGLK